MKARIVKVIIISGRSGSGKTSTSYELHEQLGRHQIHHVQIEGDNLDMMYPEERVSADVLLANLSSMWENFVRLRGHDTLVINGTAIILEHEAIKAALEMASQGLASPRQQIKVDMRGFILGCSDETAKGRLSRREVGSTLQRHIDSSMKMSRVLGQVNADWIDHLETDGNTVGSVAENIATTCLPWLTNGSSPR